MTPTERPDPKEWAQKFTDPASDLSICQWCIECQDGNDTHPIDADGICCRHGDYSATAAIAHAEKQIRELMAACYRHAAAVAREKERDEHDDGDEGRRSAFEYMAYVLQGHAAALVKKEDSPAQAKKV